MSAQGDVPALFFLLVPFPVEEVRVMSAAVGSVQNEGVCVCVCVCVCERERERLRERGKTQCLFV